MRMHEIIFKENGGTGYLLKPFKLRDPKSKFDPTGVSLRNSSELKVTVSI